MDGFAQAQHRGQAGAQCGLELHGHLGIGLAIQAAALRMPDQGVAAAEVGEHLPADFTGECALRAFADVLRPQADAGVAQQPGQLGEIGHGRADRHLYPGQGLQARQQGVDQLGVAGVGAVHLPVGDDQLRAGRRGIAGWQVHRDSPGGSANGIAHPHDAQGVGATLVVRVVAAGDQHQVTVAHHLAL
ncbi:hypothetical protein D3C79_697840 [compost metagenome]